MTGDVERADGRSGTNYHRYLKVRKRRIERRRAKQEPECVPRYKKYFGYET